MTRGVVSRGGVTTVATTKSTCVSRVASYSGARRGLHRAGFTQRAVRLAEDEAACGASQRPTSSGSRNSVKPAAARRDRDQPPTPSA